MLVGVVAFNVINVMDYSDPRTIGVLLTGYVFQGKRVLPRVCVCQVDRPRRLGLGFFVTFFYLVVYIIRCDSFISFATSRQRSRGLGS